MSGPHFYETRAGRQFYEVTVPELTRQISRVAGLLALLVESQEKNPDQRKGCCGDCSKKD